VAVPLWVSVGVVGLSCHDVQSGLSVAGEVEWSMAVGLAELIGQLRAELTEAMDAGEAADLRFELGPVELELTVAVDKEAKPGAKVRFWVVELGADVKAASSATQRIKLKLDPKQAGRLDRKPLIAGGEEPGER